MMNNVAGNQYATNRYCSSAYTCVLRLIHETVMRTGKTLFHTINFRK